MTGPLVIIGAGHAGAGLAQHLRSGGFEAPICLFSAEESFPYQRPPLSKAFLAGAVSQESLFFKPASYWHNQAILYRAGCRVQTLDLARQTVAFETPEGTHEEQAFERLVLATGARPRLLTKLVPEAAENVLVLRTLADAYKLQAYAQKATRVTLIGGGYIGLEIASTLRKMGKDIVVLEAAPRLLARGASPGLARFLHRLHGHYGVRLCLSFRLQAARLRAGRVVALSGLDATGAPTELPTDLVVVGVGAIPETTLAQRAGLRLHEGAVYVDPFLRTSHPQVYAIGDCCAFFSDRYQQILRLESVQNASDQARLLAKNWTTGEAARPYNPVPWFWSEQFGLKLQMVGGGAAYEKTYWRIPTEEPDASASAASEPGWLDLDKPGVRFGAFHYHDDKLVGAEFVQMGGEFMLARQLLEHNKTIKPSHIINTNLSIRDLASQASLC